MDRRIVPDTKKTESRSESENRTGTNGLFPGFDRSDGCGKIRSP